ncbi:unnamed protein product [Litomosoides sigmodontis]|uniref:Uncharacterized protein n=1 Tax=Litomosoides sigmodontis TaxID=42156 RepID=A0A3P6U0K3_LITSI|nr:unnamed protein product [Litomosoides sigmodontis]
MSDPSIRSFQEVLLYNIRTDQFRRISGRPWTYRKYIYSMPRVNELTGNVTPTKDNIPLHFCAIGAYNVTIGSWSNDEFAMKTGKREVLGEPQKYCYFIASLQFQETDRKPPTSRIFPCVSQSHSYLMIYFNRRFNNTYIKCSRFFLFDTYDELMLIEDYSFYAPENLALKKLYDEGKKLHIAGKNYNMTVQHGCTRKIFLPILDPFCKPCDRDFEKAVRKEGTRIAVPMCLKTSENLNDLMDDKYNFGFVGLATYMKMKIKNYPLCYDMIAINPRKHGIEHRSGPFDEIVNYLYNAIGTVGRMRRIMTFTVRQPHSNRSITRYLFTCFQRENHEPCNGPINIRDRLLPLIIREESMKRSSNDRSLCHANGHANRIRCKSRKGCFDFHTVHGTRMRGCIDKIPTIVSMMPEMRLLYTCYSHAWITRNERTRCSAVVENDSNSSVPLVDGIICCCRSTCSTFKSNSYLEMKNGYYPFQM